MAAKAGTERRALLGLDADLGALLDASRHEAAMRALGVGVLSVAVGEWAPRGLAETDPRHIGLLIVEGVMARQIALQDTVSTELLGPGDIVRPWLVGPGDRLLPVETRWNALSPVRIAVLDARLAVQLGEFPEVSTAIVDRLAARCQRLAITQAISQLNRVDRRLLSLFWHLAERWGKVAADGVAVPLVISHRVLGELVGARRPTVSTSLAALAREDQLIRRANGTWLLKGEPLSVPDTSVAEVIRQRRRLLPADAPAEPEGPDPDVAPRLAEFRERLEAIREQSGEDRRRHEELRTQTASLHEAARTRRAVRHGAAA